MTAYSSSEAAQMLSITPITLRKLSAAFVAWLSPAAASTVMVGEAVERFYNDDDLDTLRYIIVLLKQNRNYSWVRERLTIEFGADELSSANNQAETAESEQPIAEPSVVIAEAREPEQPTSAEAPYAAEGGAQEPKPPGPQQTAHADAAKAVEPDDPPRVVEAEVVEPEPPVPPDIAAMLARMAELYQQLLRNKEQEITALRQTLDIAELSAANERRELEMLNRLAKMMERENQRLTAELAEARSQLDQAPARRGWLARVFGGSDEEASSASQV
jgi:MerR HTH family regulatory protein